MGKVEDEFKIIEYFEDEEEFGGDACGYGVSYKGEIIATFNDQYHEKGRDRSIAFIMGVCYAKGFEEIDEYEIERVERVEE